MESNTFMILLFGGKSILRSTEEEVEIIDSQIKDRGARSEDWVTYIDSEGKEHIREHFNIQLDFKTVANDTFNRMFDFVINKIPTTRNNKIFEVAKELYLDNEKDYRIKEAVQLATKLVDEVGIEVI